MLETSGFDSGIPHGPTSLTLRASLLFVKVALHCLLLKPTSLTNLSLLGSQHLPPLHENLMKMFPTLWRRVVCGVGECGIGFFLLINYGVLTEGLSTLCYASCPFRRSRGHEAGASTNGACDLSTATRNLFLKQKVQLDACVSTHSCLACESKARTRNAYSCSMLLCKRLG